MPLLLLLVKWREIEALQHTVEGPAIDVENFSGPRDIPLGVAKNITDVPLLDFFEGGGSGKQSLVRWRSLLRPAWSDPRPYLGWQVLGRQGRLASKGHGPFNSVLEFPDVARPRIRAQKL